MLICEAGEYRPDGSTYNSKSDEENLEECR